MDNLRSVGIATVISSGNASYTDSMGAPGCISTAVSVGSTNKNDQVSQFSNSAGFLNLLAPGENIRSSILGDGFANFNGTSMAAPHVAGAWALLKQKTPGLSVAAALNALASTGQPVMDYRNGITKPRIDVAGALGVGGAPSLGTPTALPSTNLTASAFTANWTPVNGADGYRLDVSPNSGFTSYVAGYQNLDVGNATSRAVGGLSASAAYYYRVRAYGAAGTSGNSNTVSATTAAAAGPQPLSNGQVVGGLSGTAGSESHFFIDVPSGASTLRVRMSGGTGDADLYLRRNDPPATSAYDCRPYLPPGPDEECLVASPRAGRYYIMLQGYTAYSGVTLTASYVAETSIAVPPAPTANVAGNLSANGFTANWSAAATADGYRLDVARDSGFWTWEPIPAAR
nr:S8 family serine peptidase [Methylomicrobium agile]